MSLNNQFVMNWPRALAKRPEGMTTKTFIDLVKARKKIATGWWLFSS